MTNTGPTLTDQQVAALETRGVSIALSAGAGCGKTFVLTERFLRHLETHDGDDPLGGIVAITFTDRAAREMRDRIRSACHTQLESFSPTESTAWLSVLRSLDSARITTIHSFCATLLRSHAVDAGIDPRFGLWEASFGGLFLRRSVTETLHSLLSEHDDDCMELVLQYGLERTVEILTKLVVSRFQGNFEQFDNLTDDELAQKWLQRWRTETVPLLLQRLAESDAVQNLLILLKSQTPEHAEMQRRCEVLLQMLPNIEQSDDPFATLTEIRAVAQVQGGGGKKVWDNEDVYAEVRDALSALRKSFDKLLGDLEIDESDVRTAAGLSLIAQNVVRKTVVAYELTKQQMGVLDFDDLLLKTRDLLRGSDEVRRRVAAGIDFLMVDEFQDTDPVQSEIVGHLCGEKMLTGKLFLVGDVKQSIYRFRRADPRVFTSLRAQLPETGRLPLSVNFRSQPEILNFVNLMFGPTMGEYYEPLIPHAKQLSPKPCIEFLFAQSISTDQPASDSASDRRRLEADWIARRIVELLEDETPHVRDADSVTGEAILRRTRSGDITILFRTLSNVAIYEDALRRSGVNYYLAGGRTFYAQQEVGDVVNLLAALNDPDDDVALVGVLRSPFFNLSDETLFALTVQAGSLRDVLKEARQTQIELPILSDQYERIRYASQIIEELSSRKDRISLAQLLELAIERTGYDASLLSEHLGRRKLANLDKLIDMARQFDASGMMTLSEFVQRIQDSIAEESNEELAVTHPETSNVVRLMTVHQSKGLEFPVVIVADMDWMRHGGSSGAMFHPELGPLIPMPTRQGKTPSNLAMTIHRIEERDAEEEETVRVLYVATTRAADRLILSANLKANGRPSSPWMKLLADRFDLRTGLLKGDPYLASIAGNSTADPSIIPDIHVHHHRPEYSSAEKKTERTLPLSKFRESVLEAERSPLPELLQPLRLQPGQRLHESVSELQRIDSKIRLEIVGTSQKEDITNSEPLGQSDARTLGDLVHKVVETIPFLDENAVEELVEITAGRMLLESQSPLIPVAIRRVNAFVESDLFAEIQSAKVCYRELDFLLNRAVPGSETRRAIISGQIDCLFQTAAGKWKIVDYKTGRVSLKKPESIVEEYGLQLALYAFAVRQLTGQFPGSVEIAILHDEVLRVPMTFDESTLLEFEQHIDAAVTQLELHS